MSGVERGGVLHVRGPNVMSGYLRFDALGVLESPAADRLGAGWYNTGDIVEIDDDGFVIVRGRLKRFAKIAGEMVSLETVETIARVASPLHAHASTSLPDAQRGEQIVLLTTDAGLTREALQAAAKANGLPGLSVARRLIPVQTIPLLGTGKTDYVNVKKVVEAA